MYKKIPKVDRILEWPELKNAFSLYPRPVVIDAIRTVLDSLRLEISMGEASSASLYDKTLVECILAELAY